MFCGVFPSDKLPQTIDTYPCRLVANMASRQNAEWFDSYGKPPEFYGLAFTEFLNKHCDQWEFNDRKLQSDWSDVCGHYCIFYLSHRARGQSMKKIVQLFGNNTVLNDSKVLWFVKARCSSFLTGLGVFFCRLSSKKRSKYALNNFCFSS